MLGDLGRQRGASTDDLSCVEEHFRLRRRIAVTLVGGATHGLQKRIIMAGVGQLGELQAIERLTKKFKYNAYFPLKDVGIDFIAEKNGRFFKVQVKTSSFQKNSYFWFDLHRKKMVYESCTYYMFVCHTLVRRRFMGRSSNILIIPSLYLRTLIEDGVLPHKGGDRGIFNIFVYPDDETKTWKYRNKGVEIDWTEYWNNYEPFE
jgi:hypothetical protein